MQEVKGYRVVRRTELKESGSEGYELIHEKSGARIVCIENPQDSNKAFAVGFMTPPRDNTGTPHILEHSVLCGSDKFPVKDPFVELAQGSVNTFLNAFTYADKTVYPVASPNMQDLYNLMDVYLDAVFHPNILKDPRIMMQEGWHYELTGDEDPVTIKGVVYNEMKGAYSSPDQVIFTEVERALFPHTPYGKDSGGDPDEIPTLTREMFLDFYKTYYHPSNSRIYLYGDMDMNEVLTWIDERYLSAYDRQEGYELETQLPLEPAFAETARVEKKYSVSAGQGETEGYFAYSKAVCPENPVDYYGLQLLQQILIDAEGAPLKRALLEAGLGKTIIGYFDDRSYQTSFVVGAKGIDVNRTEEFIEVTDRTLRRIVEEGLSERQKKAAINQMEFQLREADFGSFPGGLVYGLNFVFSSWLYGKDPFENTRFDDIFGEIHAREADGYFEELIEKYWLNNTHAAAVKLVPEIDLAQKNDRALQEKLAGFKKSLSPEALAELEKTTKELIAFQAEEDTPEAKKTVPHLSLRDIDPKAVDIKTDAYTIEGRKAWFTEANTSSILYWAMSLDIDSIPDEELPYVAMLGACLGAMDTEKYTYEELDQEKNIRTGGLSFGPSLLERLDGSYRTEFSAIGKVLASEADAVPELAGEVLLHTKFTDTDRMKEILNEVYTGMEQHIQAAGHSTGINHSMSKLSAASARNACLNGLPAFMCLKDVLEHFDEKKDELAAKLTALAKKIAVGCGAEFYGGCTAENRPVLDGMYRKLLGLLPEGEPTEAAETVLPEKTDEAIVTPGQVQYVVQCGTFDTPYTGTMLVGQQILRLGYLWNLLRVQGGAYGAMCGFMQNHMMYMASYRDPNLSSTLETYKTVPEFLRSFDCDEETLEKFILGAVGSISTPLTPSLRIRNGSTRARTGRTFEDVQRLRAEVLGTTTADIRALADVVEKALETSCITVVGSKEAITKEEKLFDTVREII